MVSKNFGKLGDIIMTHIRSDRTSGQRRRAGTTVALAAAAGGLLAAAMAGSPTARADDPYTDILNDVQSSIAAGEADYSVAGTDFSTAGDTNEGLIAAFAGFDNIFFSPTDYTLLGLTAAGTDTDFSGLSNAFEVTDGGPITAAGQMADASSELADAQAYFPDAASFFSSGEYFEAADSYLSASYLDVLGWQAEALAALFSAGF
jgi:hypothetical protein